jgi:hypothetical protein
MRLAWSRLWAWMWYSIWITLGILFIVIGWILVWSITGGFFWIYAIVSFFWIYWAMVASNTGFPAYIIANSASPSWLISVLNLTKWRWWRVLWNMIVVGIILSSAIWVGQQLLFSLVGGDIFIGKLVEWFQGNWSKELWKSLFQNIFSDIGIFTWARIIFGYTIILMIYYIQNIYIATFNYLVWKEITTEVPLISENSEAL